MRNRCGSVAAAALLLVGVSVALGYGGLVLAVLGALLIVAALVAGAVLLHERQAWTWLKAYADCSIRIVRAVAAAGRERAASVDFSARWARVRQPTPDGAWPLRAEAAIAAASPAQEPGRVRPAARIGRLLHGLERLIGGAVAQARAGSARELRQAESGQLADRNREALSCNALGVQLRRVGDPVQAVEQHRAAERLFAQVGNRRGEALAANNLALALADAGDHEAALTQFERARTLLHALGDGEREGKVIANIGFTKQRAGQDDEADELLRAALEKLEPESPAYRLVERQLRRAS